MKMSVKPKPAPKGKTGKVLDLNDADNLKKQIANAKLALGELTKIANRQKQVIHYGPRCPHR
jgi:hypothetical protein